MSADKNKEKNLTLYQDRGISGSGKSTLARKLACCVYSADDYFYELGDGEYKFDPKLLQNAHRQCMHRANTAMSNRMYDVAVANTFSMAWEAWPYFELADRLGYTVFVIECQDEFGGIHGVPPETIQNMKSRWEALSRREEDESINSFGVDIAEP